jgi:putative tricarboxylic transport membrane protein
MPRSDGWKTDAASGEAEMINKLLSRFCIALSVIYYLGATRIPALDAGGDPLGPRAFPMLLAVCLLVCAALLVIEQRRHDGSKFEPDNTDMGAVFLAALLVSLYFVSFESLGYLLSTILFLTIAMFCCHARKWVALSCAIFFPLFSNLLFTLLGVALPSGVSFF